MVDLTMGPLPKDTRESVAVMLHTWKGHRFVDVRTVVEGKDGAPQPTGKGVTVKPEGLPTLIDLLRQAHAKAVEAGWCSRGAR